jgi:hypothetical protein
MPATTSHPTRPAIPLAAAAAAAATTAPRSTTLASPRTIASRRALQCGACWPPQAWSGRRSSGPTSAGCPPRLKSLAARIGAGAGVLASAPVAALSGCGHASFHDSDRPGLGKGRPLAAGLASPALWRCAVAGSYGRLDNARLRDIHGPPFGLGRRRRARSLSASPPPDATTSLPGCDRCRGWSAP